MLQGRPERGLISSCSSLASTAVVRGISYANLGFLVAFADFLLIILLSEIAALSYQFLVLGSGGDFEAFAGIGLITGFSFVASMKARGLYQPKSLLSAPKQIQGVIIGWLVALSLLSSLF